MNSPRPKWKVTLDIAQNSLVRIPQLELNGPCLIFALYLQCVTSSIIMHYHNYRPERKVYRQF